MAEESPASRFFRQHAASCIIFLLAFFFIVAVTSPGLYINDEWIAANQLHQLDIGHQVILNEGKYGTFENGTTASYFISRQNVLMYSLALPLSALPIVKVFSLFGDNFRLLIILAWSFSLVLAALVADTCFPSCSRAFGIRLLYPAIFLSLLLFLSNLLLYKQFPFSAPDAPFEVAALVLANHLFFAIAAAIVFEIFTLIQDDPYLSLFGTFSCMACSSYLFWAGTAKDHMLTATVFACVIFFFIRFAGRGQARDAWLSFLSCGLLVWVRPEVGFFVTLCTGALFAIPPLLRLFRKEVSIWQSARSLVPMAGTFIGGIPFFVNNLITTGNPLIPAFDLPRPLAETTASYAGPLPLQAATGTLDMVNRTGGLGARETIARVLGIITQAMFRGFSFDNLIQGFSGVMLFPANGNIGFLIMCPLVVLAIAAVILWRTDVLGVPEDRRRIYLILIVLGIAAIFSYLPKLGAMNISHGILPDMRYLSPAYIPLGIAGILFLSRTPVIRNARKMVSETFRAGIVLVPALFLVMVLVHPFGAVNEGYMLFFKTTVVAELVAALFLMVMVRFRQSGDLLLRLLPLSLILLVITVFTFQLVLVFIFGVIVKVNGYPLWIPLVRETFRMFFSVTVLPPG